MAQLVFFIARAIHLSIVFEEKLWIWHFLPEKLILTTKSIVAIKSQLSLIFDKYFIVHICKNLVTVCHGKVSLLGSQCKTPQKGLFSYFLFLILDVFNDMKWVKTKLDPPVANILQKAEKLKKSYTVCFKSFLCRNILPGKTEVTLYVQQFLHILGIT